MRPTQQDVAKLAQVSQSTVSRVLSGDARVEPEIREKVLQAAVGAKYKPDARARSLRTRSTGLVGLAIQRPLGGLSDDPFYTSLISEILDNLSDTGYRLVLQSVPPGENQWKVYDELLRSRSVDGLLLVESEADDERLRHLHEDRFPFVLIGNPMGLAVASVDNDNVEAGFLATSHLLENGYSRVGFLGGRRGITVSEDRITGYERALERNGAKTLVWHSGFGPESAYETALKALSGAKPPDALVVLDDFMAMGVVMAARKLGLRVPADLGLVSFNDTHVCNMLEGGLTSVSLNMPDLVRSAVSTLVAAAKAREVPEPTRAVFDARLHVRGSSVRKVPS
jgi:DNA-binding LacI/PurR family transcriptional regulator